LSYALHFFSFEAANSPLKEKIFEKMMESYKEERLSFFGNKEDYYLNSFAWYPLALKTGQLVNYWE
jgi:hypothetical protein